MDQFPIIELLKNPVMRDIFPDHKTPEILMINRNKQYTPERQFYIVLGMFYTILTFLRLKINKNVVGWMIIESMKTDLQTGVMPQ